MDLGITGKRALVVGGGSGLGLACAEALAAEGVALTLFARDGDRLRAVAADLHARFAVEIRVFAGDLTRMADVRNLAASLTGTEAPQILVLNTPRPPSPMRDFLAETEDARWQAACRDQLEGALNLLRVVPPLMLGRGWGRIIGITSASVKQPMPRHAISSIFRAGVQAALKHLASELGPEGITVNAVAPATILTPTFAQYHDLEARVRPLPLRRAGTVQELGGTVAFLASQQAGFLTGQVLQLDGGMTTSLV
ncbi:MAG: SDR family oxidoreductase [Paracoccus sp. BP8]|uniref:SDR family oxidoreductase n=1 Tax=Paracoccus sp. J39 TaxID=935848 RepID=UPI00048E6287|nr:SDR family oxidoreductase [Paracoccus sp. J39]RQP04169.1 MAG: SDR family oxidoreductase [Paracoccus sp. BP8]